MIKGTMASVSMTVALLLSTARPAHADDDKKDKDAEAVQEVIITGTNIPTAANSVAMPVTVIGEHQIAEEGVNSNLLEILRKSVPAIVGRSNTGNSNANNVNQNTGGGSQLQILNLDTLVLINGRRVATSGINAAGGKNFVDINQIPAAAIQRLEVLTDGASAIYGADAVGGVVNIILKSNFKGIEAGGRFAGANGGYNERSAYIVGGASHDGANITATISWSRTDPLWQSDRPFTRNYTGKLPGFPGVANGALLNPSLLSPSETNPTGTQATATSPAALIANGTYIAGNDPRIAPGVASQFNAAPYQTMLIAQDQRGAVLNGSAELFGNKLEVFGDYLYSRTRTFNQTFQAKNNLTTVTVPAGSPYDPITGNYPGVVYGDLDDPLKTYNASDGHRLTLGFRGDITDDWNWEAAYTYDRNELAQRLGNAVYLPNLTRAIAGGYDASGNPVAGGAYSRVVTGFSDAGTYVIQPALDPFARGGISQASINNLYGTEVIRTVSAISAVDAKIVGSVYELPAGNIGFAIGGAFRHENISAHPDANSFNTGPTARRWGGGTFLDPFSAGRTVSAGFAEVRIPVMGRSFTLPGLNLLDFDIAGRTEHYSDAGNSRVPKFGARWQPFDNQVTFRFAYSRAYNAPTLFNVYGPSRLGLTGATTLATQLGNPAFTGLIFNQVDDSNPNLKASTAWTRTFGVVLAPHFIDGLTITANHTNISEEGFQGAAGDVLFSVDRLGPASPYVSQVSFFAAPRQPGAVYVTSAGQISQYLLAGGDPHQLYLANHFINLAGIHVKATDLATDYTHQTEHFGSFELNGSGTYLHDYTFQTSPSLPAYQYPGYATNGGPGVQGTLPRFRTYTTLDWTLNRYEVVVGNTFIPSVKDIGPGGNIFYSNPNAKAVPVASYTTWDLQLAYTFGSTRRDGKEPNLRVAVGANNVFDRMPPLSPQAFPDNNADVSMYSPIGRLLFATVTAKF